MTLYRLLFTAFDRFYTRGSLRASVFLLTLVVAPAWALGDPSYVVEQATPGAMPLATPKYSASIYVDSGDHAGVQRAAKDLQQDIERVTGKRPKLLSDEQQLSGSVVIVGTVGQSPLLDRLVSEGRLDISNIRERWDAYHVELVSSPFPGVEKAFVIAGANKRGAAYGVYDLSQQIGVSPWYYWADVTPEHKQSLFVAAGTRVQDWPRVKYRGIFLNDEAPALTNWVQANHGNYNHEFYEKIFELMLRLKANYLWPAMWNNAFSDDDPRNMVLADEYGIVMGTSHHEPMMRADKEWNRYGDGPWEYSTNPKNLYQFWQAGAERNKPYESIYTLGMRGQEDEPMSEGENIELLEKIVADQRKILGDVFGKDAVTEVPQVWALYKEVQGFYERGMRVPDDVILLWSDDNWGNIRRLPTPAERERSGGAGVYYHFDYVGGPRSYRWINTVPIAKIWEQMNLAYQFDANKIWITNVGDLKPMEFPTEFFLSMAWDPERWPKERLQEFGRLWAQREFGPQYADEIEALITSYTRHNGRRKPELMAPDVYSLLHYHEAERIEYEVTTMVERAEALYQKMPASKKDAFFQLVLHPVKATANITHLYIATGRNRLYANQGRATADKFRQQAKHYFKLDAQLKEQYHSINDGKWRHFMDQSHIGYTNWQNPEGDQLPVLYEYVPGDYAEMGIAVEGEAAGWPAAVSGEWPHTGAHKLSFDANGQAVRLLTLYNRGTLPYAFTAKPSEPWIKLSSDAGEVKDEYKVQVSVDWKKLPEGQSQAMITLRGTGWQSAKIAVQAFKPAAKLQKQARGFLEADGYVAIEAASFTANKKRRGFEWQEIPSFGRTGSAMSPFPISDESIEKPKNAPFMEYDVTFFSTGEFELQTILAPSLPFVPGRGLRYAVAIGNEKPQIVDFLAGFDGTDEQWEEAVKQGVRIGRSRHKVTRPGPTKVRLYMVDTGVTVQKLVIDTGGLKPSYLGPPQSTFKE